jgi:DnaK suppressor protein
MVERLSAERAELRQEIFGEPEIGPSDEQNATDVSIREHAGEEVALSLLDTEEELLSQCTAALERIKLGTFGLCATCGKPISRRRLEAAPQASKCIRCTRGSAAKPV